MADIKIRFDEMLARRKGAAPLPTAVVHPCSVDALAGALEATQAGLIEPVLVGPAEQMQEIATAAKLDLSPYKIVATGDAEESASVAANLAGGRKVSVDQKRDIVQNAIILARAVGITQPKVAVLAAVETVNSKMPATMDAAALTKMGDRRQIVGGVVDGPLDLDTAVDEQAARTNRGRAAPKPTTRRRGRARSVK